MESADQISDRTRREFRIQSAMIDAAGIARITDGNGIQPDAIREWAANIIGELSPLVGDWLPRNVTREGTAITIHPRD